MSRGGAGPIGAASGALGAYLMDHVRIRVAAARAHLDATSCAREAGHCMFLPRFDAREGGPLEATRGFGVQVYLNPQPTGEVRLVRGVLRGDAASKREPRVARRLPAR